MSEPAFFDVVLSQRACREFRDEPVADDVLARVLEAATHAPSAENSQPWVFVVVRDASVRTRLGDLMRRAWVEHGRPRSEGRLSPGLFADVDRGLTGGIAAAPVLVVAGGDTARCHPSTVASSVFPAVQNLLLAANAVGLGSALTTIAVGDGDALRAVVGLPDAVVPVAIVPLGWPAHPLSPPRREPFTRHTSRDRYGAPW